MHTLLFSLFQKTDTTFEIRINNHVTSHHLAHEALTHFVQKIEEDYQYARAEHAFSTIGQELFDWLETHSQHSLSQAYLRHPKTHLIINSENNDLTHLPWELVHNGTSFLTTDKLSISRQVCSHEHTHEAEKRPLNVVFMASSPIDGDTPLAFEHEEALILAATQKKPIELVVEERGSLEGLEEALDDANTVDIVHLSGHATVHEQQPLFLLEDDTGYTSLTTPEALIETFDNAANKPFAVFLSGCQTAQSSQEDNITAFAQRLVESGLPCVLGWAKPVTDRGANLAAATLYGALAKGQRLDVAIQQTRSALLNNQFPDWHLLRVYCAQVEQTPLIKKGNYSLQVKNIDHDFLQIRNQAGIRLAVCPRQQFVGRRRLLQRCVRALKATAFEEEYCQGILLQGMGGLGKSSAAARLVTRFPHHIPILHYGGFDERSLLNALATSPKLAEYETLLTSDESLNYKLTVLLSQTNHPLLIILDDYEQNIPKAERKQGKVHHYSAESEHALHTLLNVLVHTQGSSRIIITSRFNVPPPNGIRLHRDTPESLKDNDLDKKISHLSHLSDLQKTNPEQAKIAIEAGAGNPRLLERINDVLGIALDHAEFLEKLHQEQEIFREDLLLNTLVASLNSQQRNALISALVYHLPVPLEALQVINPDTHNEHCQLLSQRGLLEIQHLPKETLYFASRLLDDVLGKYITETQQRTACQYLADLNQIEFHEETVRLAIASKETAIAFRFGTYVTNHWQDEFQHAAALSLCQQLLILGDDHRILANLARAQHFMGMDAQKTHKLYQRAIHCMTDSEDKDVLRNQSTSRLHYATWLIRQGQLTAAKKELEALLPIYEHLGEVRSIAITKGKIANILQARGELDEALNIRKNEELPVFERLGDVREIAITKGQIADILQARSELDEALNIRKNEELPVFERLGEVRSIAITKGKIANILQARGELDEALNIRKNEELPVFERLGDVREIAITKGKIADILQARGELDEALNIRKNEELSVYERLGEVREIAITKGQIADILQDHGELDEALNIRTQEQLPVYERLGDVRSIAITKGKIADILQARGELDEALNIRKNEELPVFERLGEVRSIAITKGQIANILQARGELDKALNIRKNEQLPVYERLGDVRSIAITKGQIANILQARGELDKALNIRKNEQLPVFERLGEVRSIAITKGKIADILQDRGELDEALNIRKNEELPVFERLGEVREIAITKGKIADILKARGELDEALNIRTQEQLPVYERLGEVREIAVAKTNIALLLLQQGKDIEQAKQYLYEALELVKPMRIPEQAQIQAIIDYIEQ